MGRGIGGFAVSVVLGSMRRLDEWGRFRGGTQVTMTTRWTFPLGNDKSNHGDAQVTMTTRWIFPLGNDKSNHGIPCHYT